jgi:hypothetical protein
VAGRLLIGLAFPLVLGVTGWLTTAERRRVGIMVGRLAGRH